MALLGHKIETAFFGAVRTMQPACGCVTDDNLMEQQLASQEKKSCKGKIELSVLYSELSSHVTFV